MLSTLAFQIQSLRKTARTHHSKRVRRFRLQSELLESRRLLASDLGVDLVPDDSIENSLAAIVAVGNASPTMNDLFVDTPQETLYEFDPLDFASAFSDPDGDGLATATITALPSFGTLETMLGPVTAGQSLTLPLLSTLTYQPNPGFAGDDLVLFNVTDDADLRGETPATSNVASVFINVIGENTPPSLDDLNIDVEADLLYQFMPLDFDNAFSDPEGDGLASVTFDTLPTSGTLSVGGVEVAAGQVVEFSSLNTLTYQPDTGFVGEDTLVFTVTDDADLRGSIPATSEPATAFISVAEGNEPPVIGTAVTEGTVTEFLSAELFDEAFVDTVLFDTGTFEFSDTELGDTHIASATFQSSSAGIQYGFMTAQIQTDTTGTGQDGVLRWDFSVSQQQISFLAPGESITETYTVELQDDASGSDSRDVTITMTGAINDFVVTTVTDVIDPNDGLLSLREAITQSNQLPDETIPNAIQFDFPPVERNEITEDYEIILGEVLPTITRQVAVVGYRSVQGDVVIDGSDLVGATTDGIRVQADDVRLRRLTVRNFTGDGVQFSDSANGILQSLIVANNDGNGIFLVDTNGSYVGENTIHWNGLSGLEIRGDVSSGGGNTLESNLIGVESISPILPSSFSAGVDVASPGFEQAAPNGRYGILLRTGSNDVLGNIVSGNALDGIALLGGTEATGNFLTGNNVGTDSSGNFPIGNGRFGILLNSSDNIVGDFGDPEFPFASGLGNLISANGSHGVAVLGSGATGNFIVDNVIGLNALGSSALPNGGNGVFVNGASGNFIGEFGDLALPSAGNLISGNTRSGIRITGGSSLNVVGQNGIGVDSFGSFAIANGQHGIEVSGGSSENEIAGNTIAGNTRSQVHIIGADTQLNTVASNLIGISQTESGLQRIDAGSYAVGVFAPRNTIGGGTSDQANLISGSQNAILLGTADATDNVISNNLIGTDGITNDPSFGTIVGINLARDASDNVISQNTIANIIGDGIRSVNGGTGNTISQNSFVNTNTEIDLGENGPTPNDSGDIDTGPNNLQNKPIIESVTANPVDGGLEVGIEVSVDSASFPVTVEFFAATGIAEVISFLGSVEVTDSTITSFTTFLDDVADVAAGNILATATDPLGNTSEFSFSSPLDVSGDGILTSLDALMVVNFVGQQSIASGERVGSSDTLADQVNAGVYDTNRDGKVSALDALVIINELGRSARKVETKSLDDVFASLDDDEDFFSAAVEETLLF